RWVSYRDYLKEQARSDQWIEPDLLNRNLPYAVAFDIGDAWTGKYQQQGVDTALPWLINANGEMGNVSSLVAAVSVISSAGDGGASSGAGAGGGGGGASGAG
ncbi:MAG TPA: hypothetical protein VFF68_10285, partial [Anaerolineaceae bacterium]|nr:hypothetical protein [Anaerolineaceae bacterium]